MLLVYLFVVFRVYSTHGVASIQVHKGEKLVHEGNKIGM